MAENVTGLFGKLPAHGDFVMRDLPSGFVTNWDEWLQHYIAGSKEQLGENWLNIYLTSPIWRFAFSDGVIDGNFWAGVMLPSVDRVGRYYPISAVLALPENSNPLEFITMQIDWFLAVEDLMLQSLNGDMTIDDLSERINELDLATDSPYTETNNYQFDKKNLQINMEFEEQTPISVYPYLFNTVLKNTFKSYSVWSTSGSELIEPCLFLTQGMPEVGGLPAMIDGQWQQRGWQQPYMMQEFAVAEQA